MEVAPRRPCARSGRGPVARCSHRTRRRTRPYSPPTRSIAGSGNAEVHAVNVSCAAPNGTYSVVWVARITSLSPHNTPTVWSVDGQTASVNDPIIIVTGHTRQAVLFSTPPRIAAVAVIGMSRPVLTASTGVPGYC